MISRIFIDRPIFAWVIVILIMLGGVGAILTLPVAQYPDVAPPSVNISATYPGASAKTLETSVTQVIEQQLTGIDGLLYFSSQSSSRGTASISVTFDKGTDPDIAQVQVQNKVQQALPRLPQEVQAQGLVVTKSLADFLLVVGIYDETDKATNIDISDWITSNLQDQIGRLPGVGNIRVFGSSYAMRIWLDPFKLESFELMPSDVAAAVRAQNTQVAAGEIGGQPMPDSQMLNATVTAQSRMQTPEQFRQILLKTQSDGSQVRLEDVARVELGADNYAVVSRLNGHPGAGLAVQLAPGANALDTSVIVKKAIQAQASSFPQGWKYVFPRDTTDFIRLSISEVIDTLIIGVLLVVVVMFAFLQSWRATLIPAIAVPVVLLGTFGVLALFGYSINTLTLFGLVLSIGLLVDDAIVVVENVERVLEEEPNLSPREATIKSMGEIQTALIAIALVLSAVFLPMAFFGGSTGVIYRQFSVTIVSSMLLSVVVALIFSPALAATVLKPKRKAEPAQAGNGGFARLRRKFHGAYTRSVHGYVNGVAWLFGRKILSLLVFGGLVALLVLLFMARPTGFLPTEDQGYAFVSFTLPPGATAQRSGVVARDIERYFATQEGKNVQALFTVTGFGFGGAGQNTGLGFMNLSPWDQREGEKNTASAITGRATGALSNVRDAQIFALTPPPVSGMGQSNGFTLELQNSSAMPDEEFRAKRDELLAKARQDPKLTAVRYNGLDEVPTLHVDIDQAKVGALGLTQTAVNSTLSAALGDNYLNDFVDRGRVKRVYMEGAPEYRTRPEDLDNWYVRSSTGKMAPFSAFSSTHWEQQPSVLQRFNGLPSYEIQGQAAEGQSSGDAMAEIARLAQELGGVSVAWSGLSYQENLSSGQAGLLYSISLLIVFLCLAALYESWTVPLSVLVVVPLGVLGAVLGVTLRGLPNDVYFQVGLLTTMGLTAKNAILIVEFAEQAERAGKTAAQAALEAARLRLRPILMTSLAFVAGTIPLAVASGAGAQSRIAIGTAVVSGMVAATVLVIFYGPLFYLLVRKVFRGKLQHIPGAGEAHEGGQHP